MWIMLILNFINPHQKKKKNWESHYFYSHFIDKNIKAQCLTRVKQWSKQGTSAWVWEDRLLEFCALGASLTSA